MKQLRGRWIMAGGIILLACTDSNAPPGPAKLTFTVQPTNAAAGVAISPAVAAAIQDTSGHVVTSATNLVTVTLGAGPGRGSLAGTRAVMPRTAWRRSQL